MRFAAWSVLAIFVCVAADTPLPPDDRFKADILLIVAHPDDETQIGPYLARAIYDEHKRVAVIFGTRGNGGGNSMGLEQAAALGAIREIEGRRALASWGVMNVWFLGGPDTPGQDVLRSLETWNHGNALWQVVRIVRLTRPQVILTWLPLYSAGENHGDHQAAAVIATEAFDLAGDPTFFPEQVTPPRDRRTIGNLTEGLRPWQPQKLYFFSDANHLEFLDGKGPQYSSQDISPSRGKSYARLATEEMSFHLTQWDSGQIAKKELEEGNYRYFAEPARLVFGKTHVPSGVTDEVFKGATPSSVGFAQAPGYRPPEQAGLTAELGGPWAFYRRFWQAHGLETLKDLLQPEVNVSASKQLSLPLLIHNRTSENREASVTLKLPEGWKVDRGAGRYPAPANDDIPVELFLTAPAKANPVWQTITVNIETPGSPSIALPLRVNLSPGSLPQ
jgi:LmbE family N-acetylglucosaminyl deacetylase